jgi:hypothetical protein
MKQLLDDLERLGFYKYTAPELVESAKAEAIKTGYLYSEPTHRDHFADSEDLAECGVRMFLQSIGQFLKDQGVVFSSVEDDFDFGDSYSVIVDGARFVMYTEEEGAAQNSWELTTRRALSLVNAYLTKAGSNERIYFLYGGNDTQAVFLTPEMFHLICESPLIKNSEKPNSVE